jgi:2-hydroxychromene-2-carboxylate isomerase
LRHPTGIKPIELFYDYASPWAYLASELIPRRLPGAEIVYKPIYIRGLEAFSKGLPYGGTKLAYLMRDLYRISTHEGVEVRIPQVFPINGLYAVRGALVALERGGFAEYHRAMFQATWREDRNIGDKQIVIDIAAAAGQDRAAFAEAIESPAIKEKLKAETTRAAERGVFGVPTFFVGDELYWGQDRMDYVARALATK